MPDISKELKDLPLEYIIAAPLQGAIKAQSLASRSTVDFINKVCLSNKDGRQSVKMVDFIYSKPNENGSLLGGLNKDTDYKLSVPLMTMLPIPYIRIERLTNHFDFKITTTMLKQDTGNADIDVDAGYDGWFASTTMHGHVGSTQFEENTVNREANLVIDVIAVQDKMPQGLEKILNIFSDMIKENATSNQPPKRDLGKRNTDQPNPKSQPQSKPSTN